MFLVHDKCNQNGKYGYSIVMTNIALFKSVVDQTTILFVILCLLKDFADGCSLLVRSGVLQTSDQELVVTEHGTNTAAFLRAVLQPFIETYQVMVYQNLH